MAGNLKIFFPTTRLTELASRDGGMTRDAAVEGARKSIDSMRATSDGVIVSSITAIAAIACVPHVGNKLSAEEMRAILRHADQVVTLAGTFGYDALDFATRSLCDVADGLLNAGIYDMAPIAVHVQAMQLLAPGGPSLSSAESGKVLAELAKVLAHYEIVSLSAQHTGHDIADAVGAGG